MATTAAAPATSSPGPQSSNRPQIKGANSGPNSGVVSNRRSMQSPIDGASRRNSGHKPWSNQANHPANQQSKYQSSHNGNLKRTLETDTPDKHMHDRLLYLLSNLVGRQVTVTLKSGARFTGIYSGGSTVNGDIGCVLKFTKQIRPAAGDEEPQSSERLGGGSERTLIIEPRDLMDVFAENAPLGDADNFSHQNGAHVQGASGTFKTDLDISGNQPTRERELHRWQPDESASDHLTLDDGSKGGAWDQFAANEKLFGLKTDFDENIYTTKIDTSHPLHKQREAAAAKLAREIETSSGPNSGLTAHQAEERNANWVDDSGMDEEDKYSGVQRAPQSQGIQSSGGQNKYTPPALRAQQSAPPATTASPSFPNDPAIISSQVSRGDTPQRKPASPLPVMPIPQITKEAPSPQPPSVSSFKPDENKAKEKPNLPETVKKVPVAAPIPAVPVLKPSTTSATTNAATTATTATTATATSVTPAAATTANTETPAGPKPAAGAVASTNTSLQSSNSPTPADPTPPANNLIKTRDSFKQFVNTEKERYEKRRLAMVKKDKDVKLHDLKKFAQSFKLNTPVPQDLIPILAKDKAKQAEIIEKANQNAAAAASKPSSTVVSPQSSTSASVHQNAAPNGSAQVQQPQPGPINVPQIHHGYDKGGYNKIPHGRDRLHFVSQHQGIFRDNRAGPQMPNMNLPTAPGGQRSLSSRINENQRLKQAGQFVPVPAPIPVSDHTVPPSGPASTMQPGTGPNKMSSTPPHLQKLSARAHDFKPNPAAANFTPTFSQTSQASSPVSAGPTTSRATSPSVFFGSKKPKPAAERVSISECFNPFKRIKLAATQTPAASQPEATTPTTSKPSTKPGVIDKPFLTLPTWPTIDENKDKKYADLFEKTEVGPGSTIHSPQPPPLHSIPHQGNLQPHIPPMTQSTQMVHLPHAPHHGQHQHPPHHPIPPHISGPPSHYGDQDHRQVQSPPTVMPSPHLQNANVASFGSPATHYAMIHSTQPGPIPSQYPGVPGQNSQFPGYRGAFGGPQFMQGPGGGVAGGSAMVMGAPSQPPMPYMVPGMGAPFVQQGMPQGMYSPQQMHAYPGQHGAPPPASSGYPSPGRGAPMMMHQGSQQGQGGPMPAPMMMSMSSGPSGHPPQQQMMRPYGPPPPHFNHHPGQHHPHHSYGHNRSGVPSQPQPIPSHPPSGPSHQMPGPHTHSQPPQQQQGMSSQDGEENK